MENTIIASLAKEVDKTYKELQYGYGFRRAMTDNSEAVSYLPGSSFRLWINQENLMFADHWHLAAEMIIPLENEYYAEIDSVRYVLKPGDIFIIPSCEIHQLAAPSTGRRLILLFDFSQFENIKNFAYIQSHFSKPILINGDKCPTIYQEQCELISEICKDYFGDDNLRDTAIYAKLLTFFLNYVRFADLNLAISGYSANNRAKKLELQKCFTMVYDYIDKHITDDLALETVADIAGYSKYHFTRLFKEYSGYSFYDYVRNQKINHAAELLLDPELSIIDIAMQAGFANLTTFNRTFKVIKGCTPTHYRKLFDTTTMAVHK